jgi:hypothetical protein
MYSELTYLDGCAFSVERVVVVSVDDVLVSSSSILKSFRLTAETVLETFNNNC